MNGNNRSAVVSLPRQTTVQWPGLKAHYAWVPPHDAIGVAKPNQVEIAFTAHAKAAFETKQRASQINIAPGAAFIVGADPITWSKIDEWNEAISLYPDLDLLRRLAHPTNVRRLELEPVVNRHDPVLLSIAQVFKRAMAGAHPLSDLHANSLAHLLAWRVLGTYCGIELPAATVPGSKLNEAALRTVCDFIEAHLCEQITLEDLAALVHLSPFHFARGFKATLGLAPHQYVIARRMELAKQLVLTTRLPVAEIAWTIGYENISHFRRLFATHIGVTPGAIRRAVGSHPHPEAQESTFRSVSHLGTMPRDQVVGVTGLDMTPV